MGGKPDEITFKGLDDINIDFELLIPDPIVTQSSANANITTNNDLTLSIPDPIRLETESSLKSTSGINLDVQPLTFDVCMKLEFGKLPPTCIRQPYKHRFGITLFGVEMIGFNFVGESRTVIEDVQAATHVVWGGEQAVHHSHDEHKHHHHHAQPDDGGLRIRLD